MFPSHDPIEVQAQLFNCCRNWVGRKVRVQFVLEDGKYGKILRISKGGVTGYESFYVKDYHDDFHEHGWMACMGTERSWDRLFVPAKSMKKVFDYFDLGVKT